MYIHSHALYICTSCQRMVNFIGTAIDACRPLNGQLLLLQVSACANAPSIKDRGEGTPYREEPVWVQFVVLCTTDFLGRPKLLPLGAETKLSMIPFDRSVSAARRWLPHKMQASTS